MCIRDSSVDSVVEEGELLTKQPGFKGYIHDVGGPTANFRLPSCAKQMTEGTVSYTHLDVYKRQGGWS